MQDKTNAEVRNLIEVYATLQKFQQIEKFKKSFKYFNEGDRVKLNTRAIKEDVDYSTKDKKWKRFVDENADTIFTIEYDPKHQNKPSLVCFKEDKADPKWLWYVGDLDLVEAVVPHD